MCPKRKRRYKVRFHPVFYDEDCHDASESEKILGCTNERSISRGIRYRAGQEDCKNDFLNMIPTQSTTESKSSSSQTNNLELFLNGLKNLRTLTQSLLSAFDKIANPQAESRGQQQGYGNDFQYLQEDSPQRPQNSVISIPGSFHNNYKNSPAPPNNAEDISGIKIQSGNNFNILPNFINEIENTQEDPLAHAPNHTRIRKGIIRRRVSFESSKTRRNQPASKFQGRVHKKIPDYIEIEIKKQNLQSYPSKDGIRSLQIPSVPPNTPEVMSASQNRNIKNPFGLLSPTRQIQDTQEFLDELTNRPHNLQSAFDKAAMNQTENVPTASDRNQQGAEYDAVYKTITLPLMLELTIAQNGNMAKITNIKFGKGHPTLEQSKSIATKKTNGGGDDQTETQHFPRRSNQPKNTKMKHSELCQCEQCPMCYNSIPFYSF